MSTAMSFISGWEISMNTQEMKAVEMFVAKRVSAKAPADPREIVRDASEQKAGYSAATVNKAIWRLVGSGKLAFTRDWQLVKR